MAKAGKKRVQSDGKGSASSDTMSSVRDGTVSSASPKSIPRFDGSRDPIHPLDIAEDLCPMDYSDLKSLKNISEFLGLNGWYVARGLTPPTNFPRRPEQFNSQGRECTVALNVYNVLGMPTTVVYQYDVSWGCETDATKRALVKKLWNSKALREHLGIPKNLWIYDGNKLAWCSKKMERQEERIVVDLDAEKVKDDYTGNPDFSQGQKEPAKPGKNKHTVFLRMTRKIDFASLGAYLNGKGDWNPVCIDSVNFLDHVLRERPSQRYTQIKKSFFERGEARFDLGGSVEAFKGVFASLRPVLNDKFEKGLAINVDVANGTFWRAQSLSKTMEQVFCMRWSQMQGRFMESRRDWNRSTFKRDLARFRRIHVTATHRPDKDSKWTIDEIVGTDAYTTFFTDPDDRRDIPEGEKKKISVSDYYKKKYNISCEPNMPLVMMTKKIRKGRVYIPIEHLTIEDNQRYNAKLSDVQTSQMIKFAVTLPAQRRAAVEKGVKLLDWANDPYLKHYGIKVNPAPAKVKGRILPPPQLHFGPQTKTVQVKDTDLVNGRWRLDGKKFIIPNERPIRAWGIVLIQNVKTCKKEHVNAFIENFIKIFEGHGGRIEPHPKFGKKPWYGEATLGDGGEMMSKAFNACGNHYNTRPMFMMWVMFDRNAEVYRRIKKSMDCRFGIPSQIVQMRHVLTNSGQYISNVCLKVNAKLGGATAWAKSTTIPKIVGTAPPQSTMIIGADVSHPAPGAGSDEKASFAAITMSKDEKFLRYWAQVQTNGCRVEMVTTQNIHDHMGDMTQRWVQTTGRGHFPKRVLYIRDGVSEGQYAAVLNEEVKDMKDVFTRLGCKDPPKITVVIAGKRHHIRFFPEKGDRNGNPIPGTLIESGCTQPFEFDFYLCAHSAIKGTARPIHYHVILNEGQWKPAELQSFIFEHSFQYVRSTTPVSLHPAVYYAHLAADRGRAHSNVDVVSSGKKESKAEKPSSTGTSKAKWVEVRPLTPMLKTQNIQDLMWFV
ncbi:Piwi domain-containing protein [Dendryphion nanum]|uniref:Piwi domain-containing protein n=1 Tax=Dendryphion nanum TaxID=256645 RepID=A0A9P9J1S7_9PLEO|nr:Piwi domain-containing protein [Dendryphion nanum]